MKTMRMIVPTALVLFVVLVPVRNVPAQRCGGGFAAVTVSDSAGRNIAGVTIELMAVVPEEVYKELWHRQYEGHFQNWPVKLPAEDFDRVLKRSSSMDRSIDQCGNPLKQSANVTRVKNRREFAGGVEASTRNFGFCTTESDGRYLLLKVSAPGYRTDYSVGPYLGFCDESRVFILSEEKRPSKQ
jgi:hypothetical protein